MRKIAEHVFNNEYFKPLIFKFFLAGILWLVFMYLAFMGQMVNNIIQGRNIESGLVRLNQEYQTMESKYLFLTRNLDLEQAQNLGLVEQEENVKYASRGRKFASAESALTILRD